MRTRPLLLGLAAVAILVGAWLGLRGDSAPTRSTGRAAESATDARGANPGLAGTGVPDPGAIAAAPPAAAPVPAGPPLTAVVVHDADRSPLAGAKVHRVGDAADAPALLTGADGAFELPSRPERTAVWIHASGLAMPSDDLGWLSRKESREFRLVAGAPLRVRVTTADGGAPVAGARVRSYAGDAAGSAPRLRPSDEHLTDADGRAEVLVPPGRGCVVAEAGGFVPGRSSVVEVGSDGAEVTVKLSIGLTLAGRVLAETGAAVEGAILHCVVGELYDRRAVTAKDGSFRFDGVPAGATSGGLSVRATGFGPKALRLPPIGSGGGPPLHLTLSVAQALDVLCLASDGSPAVNAYVEARPTDEAWPLVERDEPAPTRGRTGPDGHVTIGPVGLGDWQVVAGGQSFSVEDPVTVTVASGMPVVPLVVKEIARRGPTFEVRVLDPDGKPAPEARVQLVLDLGKPPWTPRFEFVGDHDTDALGVATLPRISNMVTAISVLAPGYVRLDRLLGRTETLPPRIEVRFPQETARLRFVDRVGAPVELRVALERRRTKVDSPFVRRTRPWTDSEYQDTDAEGRVTFHGLEDVEYILRVWDGRNHSLVTGPATVRAGTTETTWTVVRRDEEKQPTQSPLLLVDAVTEARITDASVFVVETDDPCYRSSEGDEAFIAPAIPPRSYELAVFVPGYLPARAPQVLLNGSDEPVTVRLTLDRGSSVTGIVRDEQGRPVPEVDVGVSGDEGASATTDESGTFRLSGLAAGPRTVVVTSPRLTKAVERVVPVDRTFVATVDLVVAMAGAVAVQYDGVPWGNEIRLDLRDASRSVVSSASTNYLLSPGSNFGSRGPSEIHTFESLPPGTYTLLVTWNGEPEAPIPVQVRLGETTRITITPP